MSDARVPRSRRETTSPNATARNEAPGPPAAWTEARPAPHRREESPPPSRTATAGRRWPLVVGVLLVLAAASGGWYWWTHRGGGGAQPAQAAKGVPVQIADATTEDVPVYLDGLGTVQAFNTVTVRSRVDGQIMRIAFQEGQTVREGDLLAQIDPRPFQAALDQAIAKKAQDEATLASTKLDLERTRQLATRSFATQQQLDQQTASATALTAQIAIDQALIDNAATQLDYATIRSPLTGRTGLRLVDQGNIVHASDTTGIVEIAQINPIAVIFTAPEAQLRDIAQAMKDGHVPVTALSSDGKTVLDQGHLLLINNEVDAGSGTVRLKAVFANAADRLWPGLSVNTRLLQRTLTRSVTVPVDAVQRSQTGLFVYLVGDDEKAAKRDVKVSLFTEHKAVVTDGLRTGERIVTSGFYRLADGMKVQVDAPSTTNGIAASEPAAGAAARTTN